ncbi:four helix bundle protein [candidate division KSB1 bacterium]
MKEKYDLEQRTFEFAKKVYILCKKVQVNSLIKEYIVQLIKSSSSVGANYIEANESLSKKDFIYRIKICRKEAKESAYWLRLLNDASYTFKEEFQLLFKEATELKKIFSSIIEKSK